MRGARPLRDHVEPVVTARVGLVPREHGAAAVDVAVGHAHALLVEGPDQLAAAHRVAGRKIEDRLPEEIAPVARLELRLPFPAEDLAAPLEERLPGGVGALRGAVLVVNESHVSRDHGAQPRLAGPQAVVGVLEVRLEVEAQAADLLEGFAAEVRAGEHDALHVAHSRVLAHVLLQRADLLPPQGVGQDVGAGVQETPVRKDEAASHDSDVGARMGRGAEPGQPVALGENEVVVQEDDVVRGIDGVDPGIVAAHEAEVAGQGEDPDPVELRELGGGLVGRAVVDDQDLGAFEVGLP